MARSTPFSCPSYCGSMPAHAEKFDRIGKGARLDRRRVAGGYCPAQSPSGPSGESVGDGRNAGRRGTSISPSRERSLLPDQSSDTVSGRLRISLSERSGLTHHAPPGADHFPKAQAAHSLGLSLSARLIIHSVKPAITGKPHELLPITQGLYLIDRCEMGESGSDAGADYWHRMLPLAGSQTGSER